MKSPIFLQHQNVALFPLLLVRKTKHNYFGQINHSLGITRNQSNGMMVKTLYYECYESMALKEMKKIAEYALSVYKVSGIAIYHRMGEVVST